MAHIHSVYDNDVHFKIDGITRTVKNVSDTKAMVVQNDHNSERFTFELPRIIEGHDMTTCDRVQVHFINTDSRDKTLFNTGIYVVDDLQVCPDDEDIVICSWLISREATKHVGKLEFTIHFACTEKDSPDMVYAWNTVKFSNVFVSESIYLGVLNVQPDSTYYPCTGIAFATTTIEVQEGRAFPVSYAVTPAECSDEVIWTSSNPDVAVVLRGIVSTIAPGTAVITANCGEYSASCTLEVTEADESTGIKCTGITFEQQGYGLSVGNTLIIPYTVTPADCTQMVYWSSSNPAVAVVDHGVVGAISKGTATITATCGDYSASMEIDVFPGSATVETVKCTGITIKDVVWCSVTEGMSRTIEYTVTPEGCTEWVYWSSSDPSIVVVDNGVIAGVSEGTATITATCGDFSASFSVSVTKRKELLVYSNASTISGGTFSGAVMANASGQAPGESLLRNSKLVSADTNPTVNGEIFWTYK